MSLCMTPITASLLQFLWNGFVSDTGFMEAPGYWWRKHSPFPYCWSKDMDSHVCSMVSQAKVVHSFPHVFFPASLEMPYTNTVSLCSVSWSRGLLPGTGSVLLCRALGWAASVSSVLSWHLCWDELCPSTVLVWVICCIGDQVVGNCPNR